MTAQTRTLGLAQAVPTGCNRVEGILSSPEPDVWLTLAIQQCLDQGLATVSGAPAGTKCHGVGEVKHLIRLPTRTEGIRA